MLKPNTIYNWQDIKKEEPDKWAFITNVEENEDDEIVSCLLLDVCNIENVHIYIDKYKRNNPPVRMEKITYTAPSFGCLRAW